MSASMTANVCHARIMHKDERLRHHTYVATFRDSLAPDVGASEAGPRAGEPCVGVSSPKLAARGRLRAAFFGVMVAVAPAVGWAVPPPKGTPDADRLDQFTAAEREWIARQHDQVGRWCCDQGDFAFVTLRVVDGQLQAKADHPDAKRGIPEGWLDVPDSKRVDLTGQRSFPDVVAAWYFNGNVQCIITGAGY